MAKGIKQNSYRIFNYKKTVKNYNFGGESLKGEGENQKNENMWSSNFHFSLGTKVTKGLYKYV